MVVLPIKYTLTYAESTALGGGGAGGGGGGGGNPVGVKNVDGAGVADGVGGGGGANIDDGGGAEAI